ncbi:DUF4105 domain-containing protein [Pelagicoccus sp. NFK12]|uniref:DUF4105 domain-containing protein n=1 Tax=Pelagicoccus enzymogenes TaxID=2773457 RepID=A0A927F4S0_9BACT|nr:DUF4105 domain-containing protein [Pelagicoccus enzymogenes]MBD5778132.1 DUF4105 domain-containing protein [Pelagicoccus enzymogenes]
MHQQSPKQSPVFLSLLVLVAALAAASLQASDELLIEQLILDAQDQSLHEQRTWRRLLHFRDGAKKSEIKSEEFFLSAAGKSDPQAELEATLRAYFVSDEEKPNNSARCRFPARYYWLSKYIDLPGYDPRASDCPRFNRWALLDKVDSISLYLVSGYFGNPASTFGHSLLKLNTSDKSGESDFFDLTINFGAMVPEGELIPLYVFRGLTGGYDAGFSDQYYYTQDRVYTRTEFRDIWDYRLNLTEEERTLLILHIWEIIGKKFTYYFLKQNCAYRIADLVDLVVEEPILTNANAWYVPVELFHRIVEIDEKRIQSGQPRLIEQIETIPSNQRNLYHSLAGLSEEERQAVFETIKQKEDTDFSKIKKLGPSGQARALDSLLAYQQYLKAGEGPEASEERKAAIRAILIQRLQLPKSNSANKTKPSLPMTPTQGSRPMLLAAGVGSDSSDDLYFKADWTAFSQDSLSPNSLEGGELVALSASIGWSEEDVFLDSLEFIRVTKLNTPPLSIPGEPKSSWQLRIATDRVDVDGGDALDWNSTFGYGRAWKFGNSTRFRALLHGELHSVGEEFRLLPQIGLSSNWKNVRAELTLGSEWDEAKSAELVWSAQAQYQMKQNQAIRLKTENRHSNRHSLSFVFYW